MSTATDQQTPVDRLLERHAKLRLSSAGMVDLYEILDMARDRFRAAKRGEDPAATLMAGWRAGWAAHELAAARVQAGRRGAVLSAVEEWLGDVVLLSETEYKLTVRGWAARAKESAEESASRFKPGVRA